MVQNVQHLNGPTNHATVWYSDESGIQVFGIHMVTVLLTSLGTIQTCTQLESRFHQNGVVSWKPCDVITCDVNKSKILRA